MAAKRSNSFFKPPQETLALFADLVGSEDELPPKSSFPIPSSNKRHRPCLSLSSDNESPVSSSTLGFNGDERTSDRSSQTASQDRPIKLEDERRPSPKLPRNALTQAAMRLPQRRPLPTAFSLQDLGHPSIRSLIFLDTDHRASGTKSQPAPRGQNPRPVAPPVPSYAHLHAPQTVNQEGIVVRSTTGGKTISKQVLKEITPPRPKKGGKTIHALLAPVNEEQMDEDEDEGDEESDSGTSSADDDDDDNSVDEGSKDNREDTTSKPKQGTEDTFWRYSVVQNDNRPQGTQGWRVLGTIFGPEGLRGQIVDSPGYGEVEVSIEKELVEGAAPPERVEPTNSWLPRSLYLVLVDTKDLETGAVSTNVHEKIFTTPALANRHAADVWRLAQLSEEEVQQRNLRNGTVINAPEGWAMKMLDELETEGRLFCEKVQLPAGKDGKKQEVTIKVCKYEVAGPRN
ncbi:hypothetical protein M432DRAFT_639198 [Thermoascus aurantiacus ATCC 26904]